MKIFSLRVNLHIQEAICVDILKMMLKKLLILIFGFLFLFFSGSPVRAQNEFSVDTTVKYQVQDSGKTLVTHDISLENNFSTLYATTYTLSLQNVDAQDVKAVDGAGNPIQVDIKKDGDKTSIKVTFPDAVVGKGSKRHFFIAYENNSLAIRTGEVWEVSIPRLADANSFRNYTVQLFIPTSFGLEAYISPQPKSSNQDINGKSYVFGKEQILQTAITAGFGQFQVFSYTLSYHLENPLGRSSTTDISLPPDTAFQKVYFSKIDPKPENVSIDEDGNWIATFSLKARERVDILVTGSVQIFAGFRPFPKPSTQVLSDNLKDTQYWQVNDPKIKALAAQLKTPKAIYEYVTSTLKYDFARVTPNVTRFGAVKALANPTQAICMEYTDLFIAIARAAGIPAREINGYAYTENPELQPLSLVADVLHAWPEYYDKEKGVWIPVDPTWGSTSGIDYFNKLDLRHFAFVIHGEDSVKPYPPGSYKLGPNPQKDVFVTFGHLPADRVSTPKITAEVTRNIPFLSLTYSVSVYNPGPAGLYSLYPAVYFDNKQVNRDFIQTLPPYSKYSFNVNVPFSLLGKDTPESVKIIVGDAQLTIPTNKSQVIINSALVLFALLFIIFIGVLIKLKKISFKRGLATIRLLYAKIRRKPPQNPGSQPVS